MTPSAEKWFEDQRWVNGRCCPDCGSINTAADVQPQTHALSLPGLSAVFQRPQGDGFSVFQDRTEEVGNRHLHDVH